MWTIAFWFHWLPLVRTCQKKSGNDCHGMTESVKFHKFHRKDQSFEDFSSKCLLSLFGPIPCISLVFLIENCLFCKNIIRFSLSHCIVKGSPPESTSCTSLLNDQLFLTWFLNFYWSWMDQARVLDLYPFLLCPFTPIPSSDRVPQYTYSFLCALIKHRCIVFLCLVSYPLQ